VEFGEPGLDLLPEKAISTPTRTLLASLGLGWRTLGMADPGVAEWVGRVYNMLRVLQRLGFA